MFGAADSPLVPAAGGGTPVAGRASIGAVIEAGLTEAPGPGLLADLAVIDPQSVPADLAVDLLIGLERHSAWLASVSAAALAAVAGPAPHEAADAGADPFHVDDPVREEVAAALHLAPVTAGARITVARDLATRLPTTRAALTGGHISYAHAVVISNEAEPLPDALAREFDDIVTTRAHGKTPGGLRRYARRVAARLAPSPTIDEVDQEFARREVHLITNGTVMATIEAVLPAPDAIAIWNALTACAHADTTRPTDTRTLAHKRADALTRWAEHAAEQPASTCEQPTTGRPRLRETHIVIDAASLLGLADNPAELAGIGPIPAPLARLLAADSTWRRLVTDPVHGHLLDYGTTTYTPPRALRNYVITRDRTCRFPGCTQPADHADLDHTTAWTGTPVGGTTSATNLHTLCRRHHRLKTHHNWTVTTSNNPTTSNRHPDTLTWTSPRGKHYLTHPPPQLEPPAPNRQTPLEIRLRCRLTAT
jgi:hypothetical protein